MNDSEVEKEIQEKGLNAPRVTKAQIDALVAELVFHAYRVPDTTTMVAIAFDPTGFNLGVGTSACVDPANFDEDLGKQIACGKAEAVARDKLWELEGYALQKRVLAEQSDK